jgi:hypothetical protein
MTIAQVNQINIDEIVDDILTYLPGYSERVRTLRRAIMVAQTNKVSGEVLVEIGKYYNLGNTLTEIINTLEASVDLDKESCSMTEEEWKYVEDQHYLMRTDQLEAWSKSRPVNWDLKCPVN